MSVAAVGPGAAAGAGAGPRGALWPPGAPSLPALRPDGFGRYGVYSLFPPGSHPPAAGQRFVSTTTTQAFHKGISESLFPGAAGYAVGALSAPTPPPGSPYSPLHLELLSNAYSNHHSSTILTEQHQSEHAGVSQNGSTFLTKKLEETKLVTSRQTFNSTSGCFGSIDVTNGKHWTASAGDAVNGSLQPLTIKTENTLTSRKSIFAAESPKKFPNLVNDVPSASNGGCSRTNPVSWTTSPITASATVSPVLIKREPICQVGQLSNGCSPGSQPMISTTSLPMGNAGAATVLSTSHMLPAGTVVKIEQSSPTGPVKPNTNDVGTVHQPAIANLTSSLSNGSIPVGIAVARQRLPHELGANGGGGGLLTTTLPSVTGMPGKDMMPRFPDIEGGCMGVSVEERSAHLAAWPAPGHGPAPVPGALWQYPPHVAVESMMGLGGMGNMGGMGSLGALNGLGGLGSIGPSVGSPSVQLVRDPSGTFILMPATEQYQQAVVWGGYVGVGAGVLLPPVQVVGAELLASTTLHHHTQTHSTRLVALAADHKRPKQAIVKFDECQPQTSDTGYLVYQLGDCRSQVNSPAITMPQSLPPVNTTSAPCLTPPPDSTPPDVQDASNQTDTPTLSEEEELPSCSLPADHSDNAIENLKSFNSISKKNNSLMDDNMKSQMGGHSNMQGIIENSMSTQTKLESTFDIIGSNNVENGSAPPSSTNFRLTNMNFSPKHGIGNNRDNIDETKNLEIIIRTETSSGPASDGTSSSALVIDSDQNLSSDVSGDALSSSKLKNEQLPAVQKKLDLSGLELLSNSIEQFEIRSKSLSAPFTKTSYDMPSLVEHVPTTSTLSVDVQNSLLPPPIIILKTSPKSPKPLLENEHCHFNFSPAKSYSNTLCNENNSLGGLGLLCALAEQRFMEEVGERKLDHNSESLTTKDNDNTKSIKVEKVEKEYPDEFLKFKPKDEFKKKNRLEEDTNKFYNYPFYRRRNTDGHELFRKDQVSKRNGSLDDLNVNAASSTPERKIKNNFSIRTPAERKSFEKMKKDAIQNSRKYYKYSGKSRNDSLSSNDNMDLSNPFELKVKTSSKPTFKNNTAKHVETNTIFKELADIQRRYKEKQRELSKLTPKKIQEEPIKRGPGRPRKKTTLSESMCSPSSLDIHDLGYKSPRMYNSLGDDSLEDCSKMLNRHSCFVKSEDENSNLNDNCRGNIRSISPIADSNSSQSSVATLGSSKKRKVGRPKKLLSTPGSHIATETIVAKKPKSKSSLVGYLLAAKSRLNMASSKGGIIYSKTNPPRPYEDEKSPKKLNNKNLKALKNKINLKLSDADCYSSPTSSEYKYPVGYDVTQKYASLMSGESNTVSKMRPKLKAEPKVKEYSEEDDVNDWCSTQSNLAEVKSQSSSMESLQEVHLKNKLKTDQLALKHKKNHIPKFVGPLKRNYDDIYPSSDSECKKNAKKLCVNKVPEPAVVVPPADVDKKIVENKGRCALSLDNLDGGEIRVLTAMGGLFYAGCLRAIRAPDVYSVTLDGERGNRPHILSREEALRDAILEVCPVSTKDLVPGTRLCAYWSQQYRCLYPGTVADPSSPDPTTDEKFVSVEFDDGDSGRIAIEDIRLLQPDYPVVEYDPNPLLTLGKRRRQTSMNSSDDKKMNTSVSSTASLDVTSGSVAQTSKISMDAAISTSEHSQLEAEFSHRERKRLKKHKKEKLKRSKSSDENPTTEDFIRKKKKKHKCTDEHCKHRKHHRKHRKHKKHHHSSSKEQSGSSSEEPSRNSLSSPIVKPSVLTLNDISDNEVSNIPSGSGRESSEPEVNNDKDENSQDSNDETFINDKPQTSKAPTKKMEKKPKDVSDNISDTSNEVGSNIEIAEGNNTPNKKPRIVRKKTKSSANNNVDDTKEEPTPPKKAKKRSASSASEGGTSKMAAFLPIGAQLWKWKGGSHRRPQARGKAKKSFYRSIHRGNEIINVGDSAVFLSTGRPDRPYIGEVEALWEGWQGSMVVRVKWYYHPEETIGCPGKLTLAGGLFESPHTDENDIQTISRKCEVLALSQYRKKLSTSADTSDTYYRAGFYNPSLQTLKMEPDIPYTAQ